MRDVPPAARTLGLAGLAPFAGLALLAALAGAPWGPAARDLLAGYGATILAFMGGCRWGLAAAGMGEGPAMRPLAIAVVPSLWAWGALAAPAPADLALLAAGLAALYLADRRLTAEGGAPAWWPALRLPLTAGAAASLLVGMAG
jgi:hypothetical protein